MLSAVNRQHGQRTLVNSACILFVVIAVLVSNLAFADFANKKGAVMARTVIVDKNNQPILVEYNEDGSEGKVIAIPEDYKTRVNELIIMDAAEYRMQKELLKEYKEHYKDTLAKDAQLMSREQFLGSTFLTADGQTTIAPFTPPKYVKSVLVRSRNNTLTPYASDLVLQSFSVDLSQKDVNPPEKGTLVLTPKGEFITSSALNIGPRVGFFGDPNKKQESAMGIRKADDKIYGPVPFVKVFVSELMFPGGMSSTDQNGKFTMGFYLGFCPYYESMETDMWAELRYASFSPKGQPILPYYLRHQDWSSCWDPGVIMGRSSLGSLVSAFNEASIKDTMATPIYNIDLKVDVMFLSGRVNLQNPGGQIVEITNQTEYKAEPEENTTQDYYDLDGDGHPDRSVQGDIVKTEANGVSTSSFVPSSDGTLQGVYLSSHGGKKNQPDQPDLVREIDKRPKYANGMLKSISKDDLKKTDIFVFRESTGDLVLERKGLRDAEIDGRDQEGLGKDDKYFFYRIMLRGFYDSILNVGATKRVGMTWEEWGTTNKLAEPFRKRESDSLKPGEWIRLVIINRATGYMAAKRIQLSDASKNAGSALSLPIDDINLMPPNLKIWAERTYDIDKGLSAGENRRYIIGSEGAALASDAQIEVFTEWLDDEDRPLPEGLGADNGEQYGLTGRLAKVVSNNTLAAVAQGQLASFPIAPGRHTQILRVKDNLASPEHFYIHVSGTAKDDKPDFGAAGPAAAQPFDSRPKGLTPFLTPLFNENSDWFNFSAWMQARFAYGSGQSDAKPMKPEPIYGWGYRPEYQFSQYDLAVKDIKRTSADGTTTSLLDDPTNVVANDKDSDDTLINVFYSLVSNHIDRLAPIVGEQDLVMAIGQEEIKVTVKDDGEIKLNNIAHLAHLSPYDFLTIRLYANNDAGNILWEYAFGSYGSEELNRTYSLAMYEDQPALVTEKLDGYTVINIPLESDSDVKISLLDNEKKPLSTLVPSKRYSAGLQHLVLLRTDLENILPRAGVDGYLVVDSKPANGEPARQKIYQLDVINSVHGEMLGQIIQYDTLIQRGSLSLRREDMTLPGPGPQLDFSRSFSNEEKPENSKSVLSPGWSHNHDIFVKILAQGDNTPPYENNLPGWIRGTRESQTLPKILDHQTLENMRSRTRVPTVVAVSNGGSFKRSPGTNNWIAQRGNHGTLTQLPNSSWEYTSKDGTRYTFESNETEEKYYIQTISDRNNNTLNYSYANVNGQRLLLSVTDAANRRLTFSYSATDNGRTQLDKVENSVGVALEFSYFKKPSSGTDQRIGMLQGFKRGDFTETYDYSRAPADPSLNLTSTTDANGHTTRYEYYAAADVPVLLENHIPGLNKNDVVHKVYYPSTSNDWAELLYPVTATGNIRKVIDLRRNETTYTLNAIGNPVRVDEPEGKSTTMEWSADMGEPDNLLRKKEDLSISAKWEYTYDSKGNMTGETDPYGNKTKQSWNQQFAVLLYREDKNGSVLQQTLDGNGNVTKQVQSATIDGDDDAAETKNTYGTAGAFRGVLKTTKDDRGNTTAYEYDANGYLASVTGAENSVTTYVNNERGLRTSETDANSNTTTFVYDDLDRLIKTTDAEGNTQENEYDAKGNKLSETTRDTYLVESTPHNRYLKQTYTYDARDRVSKLTRDGKLDSQNLLTGNKAYTYDGNSNLLTETDWNGAETSYTYDALNRRITSKNRGNDTTQYAYTFTTTGLVTDTTDVAQRLTREYTDKLGRKTKIVHPQVTNSDGSTATYQRTMAYDKLTNVTEVVDENGNSTKFAYDGRNLKIKQTNADNKDFIWEYDGAGNNTRTIDEEHRETYFAYDKQNRLKRKELPSTQYIYYDYFPNGNIQKTVDPWDFETSYTYNNINQRTSITQPDGGVVTESYTKDGKLVYKKDAENRTVTSLYGPEDRLTVATDARGRTTSYTYDNNGNVTDTVLAWNDVASGPTESKVHNTYDVQDRLITSSNAYGTAIAQLVTYDYDKLGNLTKETRPDGRVTEMVYDELNRAKIIKTASVGMNNDTLQLWDGLGNKLSVTDRRGNTTKTKYDALSRPTEITDADNNKIVYTYDKVGNKLTETDRRGNVTEHKYDDINRETERFVSNSSTPRFRLLKNDYDIDDKRVNAITDANGNRVESELDWRGNTLTTTLPAAANSSYATSQLVNVYDKSGLLTSAKDAAGFETTYTYFADGSIATSVSPEQETTQFAYDLFGNKAVITKPKNNAQTYVYDELKRLVEVRDAQHGKTRFVYDRNNNLIDQYLPAANDSGETHVEYTYDALNRKRSHVQHKSGNNLTTTMEYDAEGNLTKTIDPKNQVFINTYDALNRLTTQQLPTGSDVTSIATTYDANGNVDTITETNANSTTAVTTHTYDVLNRLSTQNQRGHAISYLYDQNGNRTKVTSGGGSTSYSYDTRNRLSTVTANGVATYQYLDNGWLEKVTHANGTSVNYTYDKNGRPKTVTNALANGTVLSSFAYTYDLNGNRTQQIETQNGFLTLQQLTTDYTFDTLDRLESYKETSGAVVTEHTFTYYPSYDRKTELVTSNGATTPKNRTYTYDETYWLKEIAESSGAGSLIKYTYDNNGNSIHKTDTSLGAVPSVKFTYNSRNQLTSVAQGTLGGEIAQGTSEYNYAGMRIRHLGSERGDIEYIYDGQSILDEVQNNTSVLVAHYRYGDRLLSLTNSGSDQFYHYSALGTTANLTNASGQQQVAYRTDTFGKVTQQEGTSVNRHIFTGQETDEKTGLIYFGARFYDPDTARFINQDSYLGESTTPPSLHRYLYAYANPTVYFDADGHESVSTMIDNAAEGCGAWSCAGWAALKGVYTVGTLGFATVHDPVRDAYDQGKINSKQYKIGVAGGAAVAGVNIAATVMTAGTGTAATTAVGTTLVSRLIAGSVTGATVGLANDSVTQATHINSGIQESYDIKQATTSTLVGGALGGGSVGVIEGTVAARNAVASMRAKPSLQSETVANKAATEAGNNTKPSLSTESPNVGASRDVLAVSEKPSGLDTRTAPHGTMKNDPAPGQSHHLLQDKAFEKVIPREEGVAVKLEGNIMTDVGSPHFEAHVSLEKFWNQFRKGGDRLGQKPSNLEYTQALTQSLRAAGYTETETKELVKVAITQRVKYGLLGGQKVPNVPGEIGGKVRAKARSGE